MTAGLALGLAAAPRRHHPPPGCRRCRHLRHEAPRLHIFVLDGVDGDQYDKGRLKTLKGLVDKRGTYYQESRAIMVAETNPNHTAMITGACTATSGIPANDFNIYGNGARHRSTAARW